MKTLLGASKFSFLLIRFIYMTISIFSWNCQACASVRFPCILRQCNLDHKLDIICLLEMRVSGPKVNNIISKLSFHTSHCVKAIEFSGGIWLG